MLEKPMLMEMLRRMLRIRHFEEAVINMVDRGEIVGAAHSYIGEEAVAVGACMALRDDDWMTGNHRSHGHPIAKGGDVKKAMAELLGKSTGFCKGKGGGGPNDLAPAHRAQVDNWRYGANIVSR